MTLIDYLFFFFNDTATTEIYTRKDTLSLHDALPISCFIQGLVRGLGATTRATSPTFVLINEYRGRVPIYHVDAYRTQSLVELLELGGPELLQGDGVTVVEWADKLLPLLPARTIEVRIEGLGDEPRTITIRRLDRTR